MSDKPRARVQAGSSARPTLDAQADAAGKAWATTDGFVNFAAKIGIGTGNLSSAGRYDFRFLTRNHTMLEAMYRGSWIVGAACDHPAEDMTRGGIDITGSLAPKDKDILYAGMRDLQVWQSIAQAIKWSRLFGGAILVPLIDGQSLSTPLRMDSITKGKFKGFLVLDRWLVQPSMSELITDIGPEMGLPKFYNVIQSPGMPAMKIHHTRALRFVGVDLPYWQSVSEQRWGASVMERIFDRLLAFDSTTQGAAQLVYKAHLRTLKLPKLRELIAAGGSLLEAVTKNLDLIRQYQSIEGLTLIDGEDEFETHSYTFAGLDDMLLQFAQQLAGALEEPMVRLYGQSPAGLSSTGEADLRNYYDTINKRQESDLRRPVTVAVDILARSLLGREAGADCSFVFNPLWKITEKERAETGESVSRSVAGVYDSGIVRRETALKTLRGAARVTGMWGDISDEEIKEAEGEPPPAPEGVADPEAGSGEDTNKPEAGGPKLVKGGKAAA